MRGEKVSNDDVGDASNFHSHLFYCPSKEDIFSRGRK